MSFQVLSGPFRFFQSFQVFSGPPDRKVDIKDNQLGIKLIPMISTWDQVDTVFPVRLSGQAFRSFPVLSGPFKSFQVLSGPFRSFQVLFSRKSGFVRHPGYIWASLSIQQSSFRLGVDFHCKLCFLATSAVHHGHSICYISSQGSKNSSSCHKGHHTCVFRGKQGGQGQGVYIIR
jgi:hypothetical protein